MKRIAAAIAVCAAVSGLHAQSGTSVVRGRVVSDATGEPLPHARIIIYNDAIPLPSVFSDADGRFTSPPLGAGTHRLTATKAGYAPIDRRTIESVPDSGLLVRLIRSAAISGRIVDPTGEPVANAGVTLLEILGPKNVPVIKSTRTDDLGEYRLGGLAEGRYVVEAAVPQRDGRPALFYPGAVDIAKAESISVRAGAERTGIDFVIDSPRPVSAIVTTNPMVIVNNGELQFLPPPEDGDIGAAAIRGRVTQPSGTPVVRATVVIIGVSAARLSRAVTTDDEGRFAFEQLRTGRYRLSVMKAGYLSSDNGSHDTAAGMQIELRDGEIRTRADVVLRRPSAVTGRVVDEFGDGVEGAMVNLLQVQYEAGRSHLVGVDSAVGDRSTGAATDDRGRYRISGIRPGRYIVSAVVGQTIVGAVAGPIVAFQAAPSADLEGYAQTYFPGTANPASAQLVSVQPSQDRTDVDLVLVRGATAHVTGRALASNGQPFGGALTLATSHRSGAIWTPPIGAEREPDGTFVFRNVPPGDYVIQADRGRINPTIEGDFAAQFVTVTGVDVSGIVMQASAGSSVTGRVTFDAPSAPSLTGFAVVPISADFDLAPRQNGTLARADVQRDLTFEIQGLHGPRRLVLGERTPPGWVLKAVYANGVDVTDRPLAFGDPSQSLRDVEVVITNRLTELVGTATDARAQTGADFTALIFPTDRDRWYPGSRYFGRAASQPGGAFTVRGLPAGEYFVAPVANASVPQSGGDAWQDPAFLESISLRAVRATLTEGQRVAITLRLITP